MYLVQHFPLETLFLYHWWRIRKELRDSARRTKHATPDSQQHGELNDKFIEPLADLAHDFAHRENDNLPSVQLAVASIRRQAPSRESKDYDVRTWFPPLTFLKSPRRYAGGLLIAIAILIVSRIGSLATGFRIVPLLNLDSLIVGVVLIAGYGWAYSALRFMDAIPTATRAALENRLYLDERDNEFFLSCVFRVKSLLARHGEWLAAQLGIVVGLVIGNVLYTRLSNENLTVLELIVSGVINIPAILVAVSLLMVYPVFVELISLIWYMPKRRFRIELYALDGRIGLGALNDLNTPYLIGNVSLLLVAGVLVPFVILNGRPAIAVAVCLLLAALRLLSIRRSLEVIFNVAGEVKAAAAQELNGLGNAAFVEAKAKHDFS